MSWSLNERSDGCDLYFDKHCLLHSSHKGFARSLYKGLAELRSFDDNEVDQARTKLDELCASKAFQKALQWLSCASLSALQLGQKLQKLGLPKEQIDQVLLKLKQEGIIDEGRLRESLMHVAKKKCWSRARLEAEAHKKGIDLSPGSPAFEYRGSNRALAAFLANSAQQAEPEVFKIGDELKGACQLIEKWKAQMSHLSLMQRQQKICSRLARRGFSSEVVFRLKDSM